MEFGKKLSTQLLDDEGSTETKTETYMHGQVQKPVRIRYEIRHRTDKTDLETLANIAEKLINDPSKFDTELKLEKSKAGEVSGCYHIVECYTALEY